MKLCADAAVQGEVGDGALGRIFALYDVVFNVGYVAAVALAAFAAPPDGWAPWLFAGASGLYLPAAAYDCVLRHAPTSSGAGIQARPSRRSPRPTAAAPPPRPRRLSGPRSIRSAEQVLVRLPDQRARAGCRAAP